MEFTRLKDCNNLEYISKFTELSPKEVSEKILNFLYLNEMIEDGSEDYGKTIKNLIDEQHGFLSPIAIATLCLKANHPKVVENLEQLKVVGLHDCPDCGAELEVHADGGHGETWVVSECNHCGYHHSTEPSWSEDFEDA